MKLNKIIALLALAAMALYSCTKDIDVTLDEEDSSNIVIEGSVTNTSGPYRIRLSRVIKFTEPNNFPPRSGATIRLTDNTASLTNVLTESSPGIYITSTVQGLPGHSYSLAVVVEDKTYTATSVMPQPVALDSLSFETDNFFGSSSINAIANYKDPAGIANYYTFSYAVNNKPIEGTSVFDDRLSDGLYIRQSLFSDSAYIKHGDSVMLQMNCVDRAVGSYFNTLEPVTGGGGFGSVTPSNPISNISGNALGYFSAHTMQIKRAVAR